MARASSDFLTQVREQAERTLAILQSEIRKRETELEKLLEQARLWGEALRSSFTPALIAPKKRPKRGAKKSSRKKAAARKPGARKKAGAKKTASPARKRVGAGRVNWDKILKSLPTTFTIDDVMKDRGARSKGRAQVYPAINRWVTAKKAKKVGPGRYKRVA